MSDDLNEGVASFRGSGLGNMDVIAKLAGIGIMILVGDDPGITIALMIGQDKRQNYANKFSDRFCHGFV
jgi:hypothetical protein